MDPLLAALIPLARLEERERRWKEDVRQHGRRATAPRDAVTRAREALAALEAERAGHAAATPALEVELAAVQERRNRARAALDNGQIAGVTAERQVAQLNERIGELEDAILGHLDAMEALDRSLVEARAARTAAEEAAAAAEAQWAPERAAAQAELTATEVALQEALGGLPAAERGTFVGLRSRKGQATAALVGDLCSGCNTAVPSVRRGDLRAGRPITCASCGRWVVEAG